MRYRHLPIRTPQIITYLIYLQIAFSAIWMIARSLFPSFSFHYLQHFFGLSLYGIKHLFLWQFLTYFLTERIVPQAIIGDAVILAIKLYIFWTAGSMILERKSEKSFVIFYLSLGIFGGLCSAAAIYYLELPFLYMSPTGVILGLLTGSLMLTPHSRVFLLNAFPMQLKTIVLVILGLTIWQNLTSQDIINLTNLLAIIFLSYFYCVIVWGLEGPFSSLHNFERSCKRLFRRR
jgi:hypothetical protein